MADAVIITETKAWMVKAWRDLKMVQRAVAGQPPFYDMAGQSSTRQLYIKS